MSKGWIEKQFDKLKKTHKEESKLCYFLGVIEANQTTITILEDLLKTPDFGETATREIKSVIKSYKKSNDKGIQKIIDKEKLTENLKIGSM